MREIKFRIWNTKEYYYTDPEHLGEYHFGIGKGIDNASKDKIYNTKEWVWQQFTGLKDKNGKEIYESDICTERNNNCKISFVNGAFIPEWVNRGYSNYSLNYHCSKLEVIGNIYENPELLS